MATHYRQYPSGMREVVVQDPVVSSVQQSGAITLHGGPVYPVRTRTAARSTFQQTARDLVDVTRLIIAAGMVAGAATLVLWLAGLVWPVLRTVPAWGIGVAVAGVAVLWVARDE